MIVAVDRGDDDLRRILLDAMTGADDYCKPITNLRPMRLHRMRDHQPRERYL